MTRDANTNVEKYRLAPDCTDEEFLAVSKVYAREVVREHGLNVDFRDLEWDISRRAKRRAGAVKYDETGPKAVILTWGYFVEKGWEAMASTIRHELIHVHLLNEADDHTHGEAFSRLADRLDASVHCERFTEPKWWVTCRSCRTKLPRYRESPLVSNPENYRCASCNGDLFVEEANP